MKKTWYPNSAANSADRRDELRSSGNADPVIETRVNMYPPYTLAAISLHCRQAGSCRKRSQEPRPLRPPTGPPRKKRTRGLPLDQVIVMTEDQQTVNKKRDGSPGIDLSTHGVKRYFAVLLIRTAGRLPAPSAPDSSHGPRPSSSEDRAAGFHSACRRSGSCLGRYFP